MRDANWLICLWALGGHQEHVRVRVSVHVHEVPSWLVVNVIMRYKWQLQRCSGLISLLAFWLKTHIKVVHSALFLLLLMLALIPSFLIHV